MTLQPPLNWLLKYRKSSIYMKYSTLTCRWPSKGIHFSLTTSYCLKLAADTVGKGQKWTLWNKMNLERMGKRPKIYTFIWLWRSLTVVTNTKHLAIHYGMRVLTVLNATFLLLLLLLLLFNTISLISSTSSAFG